GKIRETARMWNSGQLDLTERQTADWNTHQWVYFLSELPAGLGQDKMSALDRKLGFSWMTNSEILAQWLLMSVKNGYHEADPAVEKFLTSTGRLKYIKPIYEQLVKTPEGRDWVKAIFDKARSFYHPIARTAIEQVFSRGPEPTGVPGSDVS